MTGRERFEANVDAIDRAIARVCRVAGVRHADAEDFASSVKLALLANDCAILDKFEERSSFATWITVVVRRMLFAEWRAIHGRTAAARAPRPALVPLEDEPEIAGGAAADERALDADAGRRAEEASRIMREAMAALSVQDRIILRLKYVEGSSIADISRALNIAQRPLYRRIEALLADLRKRLQRAGIRADAIGDLIGRPEPRLDFDLENRKSGEAKPS